MIFIDLKMILEDIEFIDFINIDNLFLLNIFKLRINLSKFYFYNSINLEDNVFIENWLRSIFLPIDNWEPVISQLVNNLIR